MRVLITPAAEADLAAAYAFYAERSGAAAGLVLGTLLQAINGLVLFPLVGRVGAIPGTRERVVSRYPYRVVYSINEDGETIEVWRVLHDTQRWPK